MQEKLNYLLKKYSVAAAAELDGRETVMVDGKRLPLLPWRNERRFLELKSLVDSGEINGISVMRSLRVVRSGGELLTELYREFDIAQFVLGSRLCEIFATGDDKYALNVVARTSDGFVCSFELAATLDESDDIIDKHEIIARSGVACDRAVDTQIPQSSIYLYGKNSGRYTDVDAELYGLDADDCATVRAAFETARTGLDLSADAAYLNRCVEAAKRSMETVENVMVEG